MEELELELELELEPGPQLEPELNLQLAGLELAQELVKPGPEQKQRLKLEPKLVLELVEPGQEQEQELEQRPRHLKLEAVKLEAPGWEAE